MLPLLLAAGLAVMPFAEVRPGQRGVCLTEWSGGEKISIPVEVLGTLAATQPGRRAILVRLDDPRFADAGVVAGMSGSPVYVDGKLLGAVAFGWSFAREPLAGVTPFEDMQAIPADLQPAGPGSPAGRAAPPPAASSATIATLQVPEGSLLEGNGHLARLLAALRGQLDPSSLAPPRPPGSPVLPLAIAGFPDSLWAESFLRPLGLQPVPAGSRELADALPEAGDMVAAVLVWGDAMLAAGGTLTARDGGRVFAFGHPLFAAGGVRMPAARAQVLAVQASYAVAFKIFTVGQPFGTFVADQPAGMVAVVGKPPAGLPVRVAVAGDKESAQFAFYLAEVPLLKPLLAAFLTATSLGHNQGPNADLTVQVTARASWADGSIVQVRQATAGPDAVARVATFVGALVALLADPPFPAPGLSALELELARSPHASASIVEVVPHRRKVRLGEEVTFTVRLQPYRDPVQSRTFSLKIPSGLSPGKVDLIVADGASFADYALRSEKRQVSDFTQLLSVLARLEPSSNLVAALETREPGLSLPAGPLLALPPSIAASFASALTAGSVERVTSHLVASQRWPFPYPLAGGVRVSLEIVPPEAP